jgi:hypothetical protein
LADMEISHSISPERTNKASPVFALTTPRILLNMVLSIQLF